VSSSPSRRTGIATQTRPPASRWGHGLGGDPLALARADDHAKAVPCQRHAGTPKSKIRAERPAASQDQPGWLTRPATRVPQRHSLRPLDDQGRSAGTGSLHILVRRTRTQSRSAHLAIALRRRPRPDRRRGHVAARTRRSLLVRLPRHLRRMLCPRIGAARRGHSRPATDPGVLNGAFDA